MWAETLQYIQPQVGPSCVPGTSPRPLVDLNRPGGSESVPGTCLGDSNGWVTVPGETMKDLSEAIGSPQSHVEICGNGSFFPLIDEYNLI